MTGQGSSVAVADGEYAADLVARHEELCWRVAHAVGSRLPREDREDIAAEVRAHLLHTVSLYDPTRTKFITYAYRGAWQQGKRAARLLKARGVKVPHGYDVAAPRIGDLDYATDPGGPTVADDLEAAPVPGPVDSERAFWGALGRQLTGREYRVLAGLYRDGLTLTELGRELRVAKSRVQQIRDAAMGKVRVRVDHALLERLAGECAENGG